MKFQGRSLTVTLDASASVADLKRQLESETRVQARRAAHSAGEVATRPDTRACRAAQPKRQKLLGLKPNAGGLVNDDTLLAACVPPKCVMLMGYVRVQCGGFREQSELTLGPVAPLTEHPRTLLPARLPQQLPRLR